MQRQNVSDYEVAELYESRWNEGDFLMGRLICHAQSHLSHTHEH